MQTRADGLSRLEPEGWTGHADQSRRFMQTRTRRLDRPCKLEQMVKHGLCRLERKVCQALQTTADGLAWTMQTTVEQKAGRPCKLEQTV
jgi:hypothetical protein